MKFKFKSLVIASAFMAAGGAHAVTATINQGESLAYGDYTISGLTGSGTLTFSQDLLDTLNLGVVGVTGVAPATPTITGPVGGYTAASAAAPVLSLTGTGTGADITIIGVGTEGGATQTVTLDSVDAGVANGTGFVTIKDLRVDLVNQDVYATIVGDNGVGTQENVKVWRYQEILGDTTFNLDAIIAAGGTYTANTTLRNLQIYSGAYNLLVQGTNLNGLGADALAGVNNGAIGYGTITSSITVSVSKVTPAVPEPGTYALMGVGLAAIGFAARRKAR
ncbi:putative secreted protein with PEP-CTERM sorting signal [Aquabacterium commune]|uniref:Putative secreted protein with PEP-CTERM sorting signal n=1 Tax=Aquabacterium commune TaxID=70586 RepID=A0A4R6RHX4_9BURK|nr:PEP-CTERM sorting domain-containing protein [Aquabacterium commune]TDP86003.1 putative secreted protein with PEP-CTERM sorting signal [Aquabacterium commune]